MKGIVLAGGTGSRLYPITRAVGKQLIPIYDKPMIYYPLSVLMLAGIRDILVITTPHEQNLFKTLLGDGQSLGLRFSYEIQPEPKGIPQAFLIGREFARGDAVALILGDNILYGHMLQDYLREAANREKGATIFAYQVRDPERYGVVNFDKAGNILSIVEKPAKPESPWAVTGLYFCDKRVFDMAKGLKPSARGELEITDVINGYMKEGELHVEKLGRGIAWLDTGTPHSFLQASNFIQTIEERQGLKIACLEEIAYNLGYITKDQLRALSEPMRTNDYGQYLLRIMDLI